MDPRHDPAKRKAAREQELQNTIEAVRVENLRRYQVFIDWIRCRECAGVLMDDASLKASEALILMKDNIERGFPLTPTLEKMAKNLMDGTQPVEEPMDAPFLAMEFLKVSITEMDKWARGVAHQLLETGYLHWSLPQQNMAWEILRRVRAHRLVSPGLKTDWVRA